MIEPRELPLRGPKRLPIAFPDMLQMCHKRNPRYCCVTYSICQLGQQLRNCLPEALTCTSRAAQARALGEYTLLSNLRNVGFGSAPMLRERAPQLGEILE